MAQFNANFTCLLPIELKNYSIEKLLNPYNLAVAFPKNRTA